MVDFVRVKNIFDKFKVSQTDLNSYMKTLSTGSFDEMKTVLDGFILKYVRNPSSVLSTLIRETIIYSMEYTLLKSELNTLESGFTTSTLYCERILTDNFNKLSNILINKNLDYHKLTSDRLRKKIRENVLNTFRDLTTGRMASTRSEVLFYVRKLQEDLIRRNLDIRNFKGVADNIIHKEIEDFKKDLLKRFPRMDKLINDGSILRSRSWIDEKTGKEKFRSYTLDDYAEMSIKRTLLNIDIESVELSQIDSGNHVVEFYLRDNRTVEEPNETCAYILNNFKMFGKVLLALDNRTASLLGIWTVSKAKAKGSLSIVRHCRHSIRDAGEEINLKVKKILKLNEFIYQ